MKDLQRSRLDQANESLTEAKALREGGMDIGFVLNNLYLAFYYPVIALVYEGNVPEAMQSVTIGLFDQQFVRNGIMPLRFFEALRRVADLKPSCSGGNRSVTNSELGHLLLQAEDFITTVEQYCTRRAWRPS
jgi:uncharacterized protein (UPF0332 family)